MLSLSKHDATCGQGRDSGCEGRRDALFPVSGDGAGA